MTTFFNNPNPFATPVGHLIEKATDATSPDDNYELYFEICDLINVKEENAKDAMRAIRKKLSIYSGKNWSVVLKLLKLLETCSNNCNKRFQIQLANKDLLQDLKSMIGPKLQPPLVVQEKVLYLVQHWATVFKNDPDFKAIESFYAELRTKGVDFPVHNPETDYKTTATATGLSPKQTPKATAIHQTPNIDPHLNIIPQPQAAPPKQYSHLPTSELSAAAIKLNEEQIAKLNSELDIVDCNVQVLNEILNNIQSASSSASVASAAAPTHDIELLQELNRTCREMQKRIAQLIGNITNENVIGELLRINDDLNNAFLRYERFERSQNPNSSPSGAGAAAAMPNPSKAASSGHSPSLFKMPNLGSGSHNIEEKPLIDFNDGDGDDDVLKTDQVTVTTGDLNKLSLNSKSIENGAKGSALQRSDSKDPDNELNEFLGDENEIREMENWLKSNEGTQYYNELNKGTANKPTTEQARQD